MGVCEWGGGRVTCLRRLDMQIKAWNKHEIMQMTCCDKKIIVWADDTRSSLTSDSLQLLIPVDICNNNK